jgi:hypothetical protein
VQKIKPEERGRGKQKKEALKGIGNYQVTNKPNFKIHHTPPL